ncbi:unnamed protein product, partial [Allacma fusca]
AIAILRVVFKIKVIHDYSPLCPSRNDPMDISLFSMNRPWNIR